MSPSSPIPVVAATRRDISKTISATKNLRAISMSLVQKVRSREGISSTQIANELAKEAVEDVLGALSLVSNHDLIAIEKNIRRRLYDSLKVLVSIGAITRTKKDKALYWNGVSHLIPLHLASISLQAPAPIDPQLVSTTKSISETRQRIQKKNKTLQNLMQQKLALEMLCLRNSHSDSQIPDQKKLRIPFVVIRTPEATAIELQSSSDRKSLSFTFSDVFEVVNDASILDRIYFVDNENETPSPSPKSQPRIQPLQLQHPVICTSEKTPSPSKSFVEDPHNESGPPLSGAEIEMPKPLEELLGFSPKRQRVPSRSPFAKFTCGKKPPASPAPTARRQKLNTSACKYVSPLAASLEALKASPGAPPQSPSLESLMRHSPSFPIKKEEPELCDYNESSGELVTMPEDSQNGSLRSPEGYLKDMGERKRSRNFSRRLYAPSPIRDDFCIDDEGLPSFLCKVSPTLSDDRNTKRRKLSLPSCHLKSPLTPRDGLSLALSNSPLQSFGEPCSLQLSEEIPLQKLFDCE